MSQSIFSFHPVEHLETIKRDFFMFPDAQGYHRNNLSTEEKTKEIEFRVDSLLPLLRRLFISLE